MKKQLVLTIEEELIPVWKREAKSMGISLSNLIEKRMGSNLSDPKSFDSFFRETSDLIPEKSDESLLSERYSEKH